MSIEVIIGVFLIAVVRVVSVEVIIGVSFFIVFNLISYSSVSKLRGSIIASKIASSLTIKALIFSFNLVFVIVRV